jgi:Ca-activated chloride channel family protein
MSAFVRRISWPGSAVLVLCAAATASAQGLLIPTEPSVPPLAIRSHRVTVDIDQQGAVTQVEQIFENNTDRRLEARFLFPIPRGAVMTKFTMLVNGVEKSGELVEKKHARDIYNSIVSRAQDPGLLEYLGNDLFRANIFPIEPRSTQRITVRYNDVARRSGELVGYTYPLRTSDKRGPQVRQDFTMVVNVKSANGIKSVYSPTHSVMVSRPSENEARVSFEQNQATLDKDFQLFYTVSDKDVGLNLVTYRPDPAKPGYFLMLVSPKIHVSAAQLVQRDVIFVMDNSGSMAGDKIIQARNALKYCVNNLNEGDRFNIVKFSTDVEPWKSEPVSVKDFRASALQFIDTIEAEGGTNIDGALKAAVSYKRDPTRPYIVVFFTDGKPTLGDTTDPKQILKNLQGKLAVGDTGRTRIFTWGVGYDVDTHLLDQIAEAAGGVSEYVKPKEDIAVKVAEFFGKAGRPVLTDLRLEGLTSKIQIVDMYPRKLPDLYAGSQLVVFGRYTGDGAAALRLSGSVNEKNEAFTYEADFAAREARHGFIEPLWAKRRIGHLLDAIRLHGETKELVDDVIRLSREYGIQTPYTSYLILEDGMTVPARPGDRPVAGGPALLHLRGEGGGRNGAPLADEDRRRAVELERKLNALDDAAKPAGAPPVAKTAAEPGREQATQKARQEHNEAAKDLAEGFGRNDGKSGVAVAGYLKRLKETDNNADTGTVAVFKRAAGTKFYNFRGIWVDERFEADFTVTHVKFGSDGYFKLLDAKPELAEALKIGTALIYVTAPGKALMVSPAGEEKLTDEQIAELFKPVVKEKK